MKIDMAEGDYFNPGMIVACTTCHGQKVEGEVMAFDYQSKVIALKSPSASGKPNTHDVRIINLALVSDVSVIKESQDTAQTQLTNLNQNKLLQRTRHNLEEKRRQVEYIGDGVSAEAQKILHSITKTITDVKWDGEKIVVMDQVVVAPPYKMENCSLKEGCPAQALQHVKKLIEKYHREKESRESSVSS
ncbi:LSM12-like protein A [Lamellibrachia satsuma]|nr:LSM12-like protein A [Lamellibrachia satsuma]